MGPIFDLYGTPTPTGTDWTPAPNENDWTPSDLCVLKTEPLPLQPLLVRVRLDGKWFAHRELWFSCCEFSENVYIGWKVAGKWYIRYKCPVCGNESMTMHVGWKPPVPDTPYGGRQKRVTALRRERAGY